MRVLVPFVVALSVCLLWTIFFSLFNQASIRGYRNLGILGAYICLLIFIFRAEWKSVVTTWAIFGLAGGAMYTIWEVVQRARSREEKRPEVGFMHIVPAMALWPIMIPEAIEYTLAEMGLLKAASRKPNQALAPTAPSGRGSS